MKTVNSKVSILLLFLGSTLTANSLYAQKDVTGEERKEQHQKKYAEKKEQQIIEYKTKFIKELELTNKEADQYFAINEQFNNSLTKLKVEKKELQNKLSNSEVLNEKELLKANKRLFAIDVEIAKLKANTFNKEVAAIGIQKAVSGNVHKKEFRKKRVYSKTAIEATEVKKEKKIKTVE